MKKFSKSVLYFITFMVFCTFFGCSNGSSAGGSSPEPTASNGSQSGIDTEYLARCVYKTEDGENMVDPWAGICNSGYVASPIYADVGMTHPYALPVISNITFTFKSMDTTKNPAEAYFWAIARSGYYIMDSENLIAAKLPAIINADDVEINTETNYWKYK